MATVAGSAVQSRAKMRWRCHSSAITANWAESPTTQGGGSLPKRTS